MPCMVPASFVQIKPYHVAPLPSRTFFLQLCIVLASILPPPPSKRLPVPVFSTVPPVHTRPHLDASNVDNSTDNPPTISHINNPSSGHQSAKTFKMDQLPGQDPGVSSQASRVWEATITHSGNFQRLFCPLCNSFASAASF